MVIISIAEQCGRGRSSSVSFAEQHANFGSFSLILFSAMTAPDRKDTNIHKIIADCSGKSIVRRIKIVTSAHFFMYFGSVLCRGHFQLFISKQKPPLRDRRYTVVARTAFFGVLQILAGYYYDSFIIPFVNIH